MKNQNIDFGTLLMRPKELKAEIKRRKNLLAGGGQIPTETLYPGCVCGHLNKDGCKTCLRDYPHTSQHRYD